MKVYVCLADSLWCGQPCLRVRTLVLWEASSLPCLGTVCLLLTTCHYRGSAPRVEILKHFNGLGKHRTGVNSAIQPMRFLKRLCFQCFSKLASIRSGLGFVRQRSMQHKHSTNRTAAIYNEFNHDIQEGKGKQLRRLNARVVLAVRIHEKHTVALNIPVVWKNEVYKVRSIGRVALFFFYSLKIEKITKDKALSMSSLYEKRNAFTVCILCVVLEGGGG